MSYVAPSGEGLLIKTLGEDCQCREELAIVIG